MHLVVTGDLIGSRRFGGPQALNLLKDTLETVNRRLAGLITVPFRPYQGDAFQGVLSSAKGLPRLVFIFQALLITHSTRDYGRMLRARFGAGMGDIDQPLAGAANPALLTGPAFVAAAEALSKARDKKRQVIFLGGGAGLDLAVNGTFGLVEFVWNRWNAEVWRRALCYDDLRDFKALAAELGVSYQAIHKQLHTRGVLVVREALTGMSHLLEDAETWLR